VTSSDAGTQPQRRRSSTATPHGTRLLLRWRRLRGRVRLVPMLALLTVAVLLGVILGRVSAPTQTLDAARALDQSVLPLALDADGIWTSGLEDRPPVSEGLVQLRREGDPRVVEEHHAEWVRAYDAVLVQFAGFDLPPAARAVQRKLIASVTLSRDAVEVLALAATVEDEGVRQDLLTEVGRLRQRSEQLTQSARASRLDLEGQRADVSPLSPVTSFQEGRS